MRMEEMTGKEIDRKKTGDGPRADNIRASALSVGRLAAAAVVMKVSGIGQDKDLDSCRYLGSGHPLSTATQRSLG